ncbi:hypothetical protein VDGE_06459 [Verticillium dahliae]|uniref:Erythromycin esterase n=1 Tax=Verticillium dahliae TaxID=27337 RepID=A0A444S288_VERDA|nr:hypothetical protein VDGE_06459 [Verticillium dahliae]
MRTDHPGAWALPRTEGPPTSFHSGLFSRPSDLPSHTPTIPNPSPETIAMSPPRRRSARLASASTPKPKKVSQLSSLTERDETPEEVESTSLDGVVASPHPQPATPASSALKPPMSEMHPSKVHPTATGSSETWLGFRDIKSANVARGKSAMNPQATPSRLSGVPSSSFTFNLTSPAGETGLSTDAQRMMADLREEAAKIKADLVAKRELEKLDEQVNGRKIARAKGKSGRFSAAHMEEFKKMDSIEGHASAFRAQPGRFTPVKKSLKRTSSKANLEDTPKSTLHRSPSKNNLQSTPSQAVSGLKRTSSKANLDEHIEKQPLGTTPSKLRVFAPQPQPSPSPVKRVRQQIEDDASSRRPISRDGSSLPRPTPSSNASASLARSGGTFTSSTSPAKATAARTGLPKISQPALIKSPSKASLSGLTQSTSKTDLGELTKSPSKPALGGTAKPAATHDLATLSRTVELKRRIVSPGRFERVKSILRGGKSPAQPAKSAIPQPFTGVSQTPGPRILDKPLPAVPFTTPRRKLFKRVDFTPDSKDTPSKSRGEVNYPNLDAILSRMNEPESHGAPREIKSPLPASPNKREEKAPEVPTVPGAFTFRSDRTARFGTGSPAGFGSSPGQLSVRQVRASITPVEEMPGSFPETADLPRATHTSKTPVKSMTAGIKHGLTNEKRARTNTEPFVLNKEGSTPAKLVFEGVPHGLPNEKRARTHVEPSHPNKENKSPVKILTGVAHGLANKKRARATEDDEPDVDQEGADRGGKRRKAELAPQPRILGTPKLARSTPIPSPQKVSAGTPSPVKKRAGISMSRLHMLSQPKLRR